LFAFCRIPMLGIEITCVFVVMAIDTEQFPVATVRRVVVMVVISMVHCQLPQIGAGEFPPTAATDPGIELEGLLPVTLLPVLPFATGLGDDAIESIGCLFGWHGL